MSTLIPNWPQLGPKLAPCWRPKSIKNRSWRPGPFPCNLQDRSKSDFLYFGSIFDRFWIDFCSILDEFCSAFWLFSLSCDSFFCKLRRGAGGRGEALRYSVGICAVVLLDISFSFKDTGWVGIDRRPSEKRPRTLHYKHCCI